MAYLPGVPDVGPKPVVPTAGGIKPSAGFAGGHAASVFPTTDPKGSRQQDLGGLHSGQRSMLAGGSPLARSMGHYGKTPPPALAAIAGGGAGAVDPIAHPGANMIRGGSGAMRQHLRQGGLGPGRMGAPGGSTNYSMDSMDSE